MIQTSVKPVQASIMEILNSAQGILCVIPRQTKSGPHFAMKFLGIADAQDSDENGCV